MNRHAIATVVGLTLVGASGTIDAANQATVLLRSGALVSGDFQDIQNNVVYVRVSQDDERRIPVDGVAIIDFVDQVRGLSRAEVDQARGAGDVLVLRDGAVWPGTLEDVYREGEGGERTIADAAVEIIFRTREGRSERVAVERVARLYLGDLPDLSRFDGVLAPEPTPAVAEPGTPALTGFAFGRPGQVSASMQWTGTGLSVRQGDRLTFSASGEITVAPDEVATPDGTRTPRLDPGAPLPQVLVGALIGRVGGSAPFGIGTQAVPITMPSSGQLLLGINESVSSFGDNTGAYQVVVTNQGQMRR
jgi:hypothetical protein